MNKKSISIIFTYLISCNFLLAQIQEKISYQAIVRNNNDSLIINRTVGMQISILENSEIGTPVYIETHNPTTNAYGLISLDIGTGTAIFGNFSNINWSTGVYFIKTEIDIDGSSNYKITGTCQILSVPYAFHAKNANSTLEKDSVFLNSVAYKIHDSDIVNWNQKLDTETDGSVTNELQVISIRNDTIFLTNGGFAVLPAKFDGNYKNLINKPINLSAFHNDVGYLSFEKDSSITNELQFLSISNDTIFISNGGFVKLPATFDGTWTNLIGKPNFATVATSGSYSDLSNKPTIPTMTSQLINNSGFLTFEKDSSVTNELQFLSIHNDTIFLTNGGFVKLPFESDPIFSVSIAAQLTASDIAKWNNKQNQLQADTGINIIGNVISATGLQNSGNPSSFYIGKDTLGGIVFYIYIGLDDLQHGLIVSKTDTTLKWQSSNSKTNANRSWDGAYNTNLMTNSPTKNWVQSLGSDWYLPSIDELYILLNNRFHANQGLNKAGAKLLLFNPEIEYWTSNEGGTQQALVIRFNTGHPYYENKGNVNYVRAIKAF